MNPLSMPTIKVNQDQQPSGIVDNISLMINFKCDPSKVRQIKLFSTFDYYVQTKLKMKQVGMLQLSVDTPMGASKIVSNGHLSLF